MTSDGYNLLTIDAEDWYQLVGRLFTTGEKCRPDILTRQLDRLLDLLERHGCRATFFCLGISMVNCPELVRRIADAGHEIGSHGWGHEPIRQIGLDRFRADLRRSLSWLQDVLGRPVAGYRAPEFSVDPDQLEAFYDICLEEGLKYDSSVFPIHGRRYGIPRAAAEPSVVREKNGRRLVEFPLATVAGLGRRWPVAGGLYWRLLPSWTIRSVLNRIHREGRPAVLYFHPQEFDKERLDVSLAAPGSKAARRRAAAQNLRRGSVYDKLDVMLSRYRFMAIEDYLRERQIL